MATTGMGHNPRTVTAANSIVLFTAEGFYDTPIQLQGFQVDNAFGFGDATMGETRMGVDGKQSGGWVSHEVTLNVFLEANSASRNQMEDLRSWMNQRMETTLCTFDITLVSTGRRMVYSGYPVTQTGGSSAQKLLQGSQYGFNVVANGEESI